MKRDQLTLLISFHVFFVKPSKTKNIKKGLSKDKKTDKKLIFTIIAHMKCIAQESFDKLLIARHM